MNITNSAIDEQVYIEIKCSLPYGDILSERLLRDVKEQAVKQGLDDL